MVVDPNIQAQLKDERLKALQGQWFTYYMNKVAMEANGQTAQAEVMQKRMDETDASYNAILAL